MAVTISLYNHTSKRFAEGSNAVGDVYKLMLCTAATFAAEDTTLAGITKTETASGDGYTTGGAALTGVTVTTVGLADAELDAEDVNWSATGAGITASYGILYNDTDVDKPPVAFVDFGASQTAVEGTDFLVVWNASGILNWFAY